MNLFAIELYLDITTLSHPFASFNDSRFVNDLLYVELRSISICMLVMTLLTLTSTTPTAISLALLLSLDEVEGVCFFFHHFFKRCTMVSTTTIARNYN